MYWCVTESQHYRIEGDMAIECVLGSTMYIDLRGISKYNDQLFLGIL